MRRKPAHRLVPAESHGARLAWWAAFVATIALIAILNFVRSAEAATLPPSPLATPSLLAFESEEEEIEGEEEELTEECDEVAEDELECSSVVSEEAAPPECKLTRTDASVSITPHGKVRLTVRYVAATPTLVAIDSSLRGGRGKLNLDGDRRRFAGSGSFHEVQLLSPGETTKAMAARSFMVEIRPLSAPRYCHSYFDQRLTVEHPSPHGPLRLS
jgi:hypothetical protein